MLIVVFIVFNDEPAPLTALTFPTIFKIPPFCSIAFVKVPVPVPFIIFPFTLTIALPDWL